MGLAVGTPAAWAHDYQADRVTAPQEGATTSSSLFDTETPNVEAAPDDTAAVELGVDFTPSVSGTVSALRFYKGPGNGGTHTGNLWTASGTKLQSVTFTDETATGWQTAELSEPAALTAGKSYVVSYVAPNGRYSFTTDYFSKAKTSGPLAASADSGRYRYGTTGGVPRSTWKASNYFVDVVFNPAETSGTQEPVPAPAPAPVPAPEPAPAPAPEPAPAPAPAPEPAPAPAPATGWPDASTTGVPAGTTLTQSGGITITTPGAVIDGLEIRGDVFIRAAGVTLKNSRVHGRVDTGDSAGKYPGTLIQRVEVIGPYNSATDGGYPAVGYTDFTCDGCNIHGWGKGAGLVANATVKNSWIHDLVVHGDPANGGSHNEAIISLGGTNFTITGNRLDAGSAPNFSASVALYSQMELIRNVVVDRNLMNGGGYCLYAGSTNGKQASNAKFTNNTFGTSVFSKCGSYGPATSYTSGQGNAWSGNVMSNGTAVGAPIG